MGRMICLVKLFEDEPLVDVMALDDVLFDDLEHEFLAEHVASHKPVALAEVAPAFAKRRVTGSVRTYHEGCVVQADLDDYWALMVRVPSSAALCQVNDHCLSFCLAI